MDEYLNFAVIQDGYCVFGAGATKDAAYADATNWLGDRDDGEAWTAEIVEATCDEFQFVGDLSIICRADDEDEFDSYMKNQGCYVFDGNGWTNESADK